MERDRELINYAQYCLCNLRLRKDLIPQQNLSREKSILRRTLRLPTVSWQSSMAWLKKQKAYSHSEVIDEALPTCRPLQKIVNFSLNSSLDWYFCTSQVSWLETFVHWWHPNRTSMDFIPLWRVGCGAQIWVHCMIAIIWSPATSGSSLWSPVIRHFNWFITARIRWCRRGVSCLP